jgi:hypothetical protein
MLSVVRVYIDVSVDPVPVQMEQPLAFVAG